MLEDKDQQKRKITISVKGNTPAKKIFILKKKPAPSESTKIEQPTTRPVFNKSSESKDSNTNTSERPTQRYNRPQYPRSSSTGFSRSPSTGFSQGSRSPSFDKSTGARSNASRPPFRTTDKKVGAGGFVQRSGPAYPSDHARPANQNQRNKGRSHGQSQNYAGKKKNKWSGQEKNLFFDTKKQQKEKVYNVPKLISILETVSISDLSKKMNLKANELVSKLFHFGVVASLNDQIDAETASILAHEYGSEIKVISLYDESLIPDVEVDVSKLLPRAPVVTVMGHVDHGKTKLLDAFRSTQVVESEFGGITQHIGAYTVPIHGRQITFIDTPGHEAFSYMRSKGVLATDIVVLVVSAVDGVKPQTIESIKQAQQAKVPIVVAINKMDLPDANPDLVKTKLSEYDLAPEQWGGTTLFAEISALKKQGLESLLENICLQADILELKANPDRLAKGSILEAKLDKGRGIVVTVLVQDGTLKVGDYFVGGVYSGKVRSLIDDHGHTMSEAGPSIPVQVVGSEGMPSSGDPFQVVSSERYAKEISLKRLELKRNEQARSIKKINNTNVYDSIDQSNISEITILIKGDAYGSVEALKQLLEKLNNNEVRLNIIYSGVGPITENDINFAIASKAIVIGFNVAVISKAQLLADSEKIKILRYSVIYEAITDMVTVMEGQLIPEIKEKVIGQAEVRQVFKVSKLGYIAGCYVSSGKVIKSSRVRLLRNGQVLADTELVSLKRFKDDVKEVGEDLECGISLKASTEPQVGDTLQIYQLEKIARKLDDVNKGKA